MITQAMILAAGIGKRLRPLTDTTPKPLIPIGDTTMLDLALDQVVAVGVTRCVVNTHHLADQIVAHIKDRNAPEITISHEPELLDTGGGLAKALPYFKGEPFFVLNADIWWQNADHSALHQLDEVWNSDTMDALLLLVPREKAIGYTGPGDYFLNPDGRASYRGEEPRAPYVFSGIRIIHPRLLAHEKVHPFSIVPFFHKAEKEGRLYGLVFEGNWGDMGTLESLKEITEVAG
ncbi:MAG: nucleotidyltransferase family protein [Alphaproteobacteria bacterium]|jgi:MurNAc alpha-1-phosphate uridylyltransferase|nr:nucleotidyltransferase family protein [Alphaproteobacteria bacterium]